VDFADGWAPDARHNQIRSHVLYFSCYLRISEYEGLEIPCSDEEDVAVTVGVSGECPLPGEEVIAGLGIYGIAQNFWFNIGMVILLQILFRIGAYIILRRSR
jgi:hypothetical protein